MKGNEVENRELAAITSLCYQQVGPVRHEKRRGKERRFGLMRNYRGGEG